MIPEEEPACKETLPAIVSYLDQALSRFLEDWRDVDPEETALLRYERFRRF